MKKIVGGVIVLAIVGAGFAAYRAGWLTRLGLGSREPGIAQGVSGGAKAGGGTAESAGSAAGGGAGGTVTGVGAPEPPVDLAAIMPDGNIARISLGARIESATSDYGGDWSAWRMIDGSDDGTWSSNSIQYPQDVVVSFFNHEPVLISAVAGRPGRRGYESQFSKDFEIWVSMTSPTEGFTRVGAFKFDQDAVSRVFTFSPTEVRFLKIRLLSNYGNGGYVGFGGLKVTEAKRPGYTPLLERSPELVAWASGRFPAVLPSPDLVPGSVTASADACAPLPARPAAPRYPESRAVLVITDDADNYVPISYKAADSTKEVDQSLYSRVSFAVMPPQQAGPGVFAAKDWPDTVVLSRLCTIKEDLPEMFKKALMVWVGQGHKLIIQDADDCGGAPGPDYSFLPYPFATSNPGAQGAKSDVLAFVEENTLGNSKEGDLGLIALDHWLGWDGNELGDSNTIYKYDQHWCGHLFGTNVKKVNGFMQAYAHYGRGLIIYDGFDRDQHTWSDYRQLVTRQLAQGFDPDNLPCSARLGDFVITTEQRLKTLPMVPGRVYAYPLTLFSNQGYKGTVGLTLTATPAEPGLAGVFAPPSVALEEISKATLTVTTAGTASPTTHALAVRGTDAGGKSNVMCLQLTERTTGGIQIVGELQRDRKPTKNLEIILDVSGSMKLPLGKKTRWATALDVLDEVLRKLPDDFNVGLRLYGHRESSLSPKTCTDSELVVPIAKLDRASLLSAARAVKPKGETPLVYSVLQTPDDLKAAGGGAVILITDGEESCKGDVKAAGQQIRASGLDVAVNIVGFTLTGKQTAAELTTLAEATGGHYYAAQSGEALARALLIAAVEKFPYVITDAAGKVVAKGEAGGPPEELDAGDYTVVVTAGDQQLTEKVTVAVGGDVVLRVRLKGDKFVVER